MNITFKTSKNYTWSKADVRGSIIGWSKGMQIQEHLETIYYLGWLRIIIKHKYKFKIY